MQIYSKIKLTEAPQSFEILQEADGKAGFHICGELVGEENATADSRPFSVDKLFAVVIDECDGSFVTPFIPLRITERSFEADVNEVPVGGPYLLEFYMLESESRTEYPLHGDRIYHFCVGDVFLAAGQSNSAGTGKGVLTEEPELGVHILRNLERWDIATMPFAEDSRHNPFMSFAKRFRKATGRPVGIIPAGVGGSPLSTWLPEEDGKFYRVAMDAVGKRKIKGVLWYQGCADAGLGVSREDYVRRFESFVNHVRADVGDSALPFFTFQINRQQMLTVSESLDRKYDELREAQRQAAKVIDGVYVLPAIDALHMSDFIHNSRISNAMLGERLARQAAHELYGIGERCAAPEIMRATLVDERQAVLEFSSVTEYLYDFNSPISEYPIYLEDELGEVALTDAKIEGNKVILSLSRDTTGQVYASGQRGTDPRHIINDYGTGIPMLCFCRFPLECDICK